MARCAPLGTTRRMTDCAGIVFVWRMDSPAFLFAWSSPLLLCNLREFWYGAYSQTSVITIVHSESSFEPFSMSSLETVQLIERWPPPLYKVF